MRLLLILASLLPVAAFAAPSVNIWQGDLSVGLSQDGTSAPRECLKVKSNDCGMSLHGTIGVEAIGLPSTTLVDCGPGGEGLLGYSGGRMQICNGSLYKSQPNSDDIATISSSIATINASLLTYATTSALTSGLAAKSDVGHTHAESDVSGLVSDLTAKASAVGLLATQNSLTIVSSSLSGKAAVSHTHLIADVSGLQTALDGKLSSASLTAVTTSITALQTSATATQASLTTLNTALGQKSAIYNSGVLLTGAKINLVSASVTGTQGGATVNLADGSSNAIFNTAVISVQPVVNDASTVYAVSWTIAVDRKSLTATITKSATPLLSLLGINILGAPAAAPSGTTIQLMVTGY